MLVCCIYLYRAVVGGPAGPAMAGPVLGLTKFLIVWVSSS